MKSLCIILKYLKESAKPHILMATYQTHREIVLKKTLQEVEKTSNIQLNKLILLKLLEMISLIQSLLLVCDSKNQNTNEL